MWPREHLHVRRLNRAPKQKEVFGYDIPGSQHQSNYNAFFNDKILENIYMLTLHEQTDLIDGVKLLLLNLENTLDLIDKELLNG